MCTTDQTQEVPVSSLNSKQNNTLTCVRPVVYLEVLEAGEALVAGGAAVGLLVGVGANVDEHLVPAATRRQ